MLQYRKATSHTLRVHKTEKWRSVGGNEGQSNTWRLLFLYGVVRVFNIGCENAQSEYRHDKTVSNKVSNHIYLGQSFI